MKTRVLIVEQLPVDELVPYAQNARLHTEEQVAIIVRSIEEFGWTNPVLCDRKYGIIAGHGRVLAAQKMGMGHVPGIRLSGLTKAQIKALVIADNQIALTSGWNESLLRTELEGLQAIGFEIGAIGFDMNALHNILGDANPSAMDAWQGMPEFTQDDQSPHQTIMVHFRRTDDLAAFGRAIEQKVTPATKFVWFPEEPIAPADKQYKAPKA